MRFVEKKGPKKFSTVENFDFVESFNSPFFDNPRRYAIRSLAVVFAFPQFRCARVETGQLWKTRWKRWKTGRLHRRKMKKRACRSRMDRQARRVGPGSALFGLEGTERGGGRLLRGGGFLVGGWGR